MLIGATAAREDSIRATLRDLPIVRAGRALTAAMEAGPRIALVDLVGDTAAGLRAIAELHEGAPSVPVVALAARKEPELILEAMRAGAREFVLCTDTAELARVVGELVRRMQSDRKTGSIIATFPAKGGLGATVLATNLAGALLDGAKRAVLVDLNFQLGDVLIFMDVASRYTVVDVLQNLRRLDRELLSASLTQHQSGVFVLAQTDHLEDADKISAAQIGQLLSFLACHFDYVVCDGLRGFDERALATLDVANKLLLVVTQDIPSIKNAQRCLDVLRRLGCDEKVNLIVNRHQKSEIDLQSIADNLGVPVQAAVANDYATVTKAINRGTLLRQLAPRARVTEDVARVARLLGGAAAAPPKSGGLLRSLFGRPVDGAEKRAEGVTNDEPERAPEAV
jgi:pilus assembly protein CpaE